MFGLTERAKRKSPRRGRKERSDWRMAKPHRESKNFSMNYKKLIILVLLMISSTPVDTPVECDDDTSCTNTTYLYNDSTKYTTRIFNNSTMWLDIKPSVSLFIIDRVKGGCWTNSKSAKNAVTLELNRSDYVIPHEPIAPGIMRIAMRASGNDVDNGLCVVYLELLAINTVSDSIVSYGGKRRKVTWILKF